MRKTLAILTATILFGLSFMFSSCKDCGKKKTEPTGRGDATKDPSDLADPSATSDPNNPNPDIATCALSEVDLSEIGNHLREKGASYAEIEATRHIAIEHFGNNIGRIMWDNGHYWYRDDMGDHNGQPVGDGINCGLYALKRLLFVLGRRNIVDKNLWYQYTDVELRKFVFGKWQPGFDRFYNEGMTPGYLVELVRIFVGDTEEDYSWIYDRHNEVLRVFLVPNRDVIPAEEEAAQLAEVNKKAQKLEETAREGQKAAEAARAKAVEAARKKNGVEVAEAVAEAERASNATNQAHKVIMDLCAEITNLGAKKNWCDKAKRRIHEAMMVVGEANIAALGAYTDAMRA